LDECAGIAQVGDVFAGGALPGFAATLHGFRPGRIQTYLVALMSFGKIGPHMIELNRLDLMGSNTFNIGLLDKGQGVAFEYGISSRHLYPPDYSADMSVDDMLHLHGFHYGDLPAFVDKFALPYIYRDDGALHG